MQEFSLLTVILDLIPAEKYNEDHTNIINSLITFIQAYTGSHSQNVLGLLGATCDTSKWLFNSRQIDMESQYRILQIRDELTKNIESLIADISENLMEKDIIGFSRITSALCKSLCFHNVEKLKAKEKIQSRILILSTSDFDTSQYIDTMNCIFSAQKDNIVIDVCRLGKTDSSFLKQAASLSGGIYLKCNQESLLLNLMTHFFPDNLTRTNLITPVVDNVDFRTTCVCHQKVIDLGYICSVCLTVYCSFVPICHNCRTKFSFDKKRL
ncbi:transcription factor Tfb4 [Rozella allomycis CSF55]|uniref:General transcription and DNA repair factor IIH subunit TFB4 n=1 Tax=Rozella allomycis (strain CSF55) TaxID=988480 RepID=A0A075B077_ROZAC|nr:TFIIH subunit Tfb4/p34 domain-containing protein [Rozella allomycis CSF55]RKP18799.1 transcription factor Tfb4 [Rozella allomycis CSF55]|eukprot:EPZ34189.1 TFIIH subunit Tfb4/p34 domain-containing protein [Rozella allomycis CSF55]